MREFISESQKPSKENKKLKRPKNLEVFGNFSAEIPGSHRRSTMELH
jgi:hypothetical protein